MTAFPLPSAFADGTQHRETSLVFREWFQRGLFGYNTTHNPLDNVRVRRVAGPVFRQTDHL